MENTTKDKELLLNQWQTCVDMANSVSQRRDNMNNIFITLNLAIMAAVSITWDIKSLFILIAGITICILWMLNIRNYKLKEAIRRQMQPASCILILAGVYSTYSKWINIEIELAQSMGKKIIAIELWGAERTSSKVKSAAHNIVRWNTDSIINAIRGY